MNRRHNHGFAALPMVTTLGLMMSLSLAMIFRQTLMDRDQTAQAQLRGDYHQREESLMRAVVSVFPKKAIASMDAGFVASSNYSWSTIFSEAISLSSVSTTLSPEVLTDLGLSAARNGGVGDQSAATVQSWITSLSGEAGKVTPGTTSYADVFAQPKFAGKVPPLLQASDTLQAADALRPVVGVQKRYSTQSPGLLATVSAYPIYNLIPYPNIRFGYAEPGQPFVAKRNWWAFKVNYGNRGASVAKYYVLSLYEVPSQMPIEASAFAQIGRHQDGTAWNSSAITIDGSVYGDQLDIRGTYGASRINGRRSIDVTGTVELGGLAVDKSFDAMGVREQLQVQTGSDVLPMALSANSGRLSFVPLRPGPEFLSKVAGTPTEWQTYSGGGQKCPVAVEAVEMVSLEDQTPTKLRIRFMKVNGTVQEVTLQRESNWPQPNEAGGSTCPFQTEFTTNSRSCLTFHPSLMNAWLVANGGASVATNHSIFFSVDASLSDTVRTLPYPPTQDDMCVIVRKGKDLREYTAGMSLVAPLRVYVGDDLNNFTAATVPAGSGLPANAEFYPPVSIFAAELRVGTTAFNRPIEHHGQLGSLTTDGTLAWQPLDMKSGSDDAVHTETISADLKPLRSPAELPPVHQMNWLVVIEEIPQD